MNLSTKKENAMAQVLPDPSLLSRLRQLLQLFRNCWRARRGDTSAFGEWREIERLLAITGLNSGLVVDMAASDGVTQSSTLKLFQNPSWGGLAVETDPVKFAMMAYVYSGFSDVQLGKCRVTPENVANLLRAFEIPAEFEFLNLDIDSYDLFVMNSILQSGFRPKLISMEINEKLPPPIYFTVKYDREHYWRGDHFFGCSADAASQTLKSFGYVLASIQFNNALFVRADVAEGKMNDVPVSKAYFDGYANRIDRAKNFPWNADVDCALTMSPAEALSFFSTFFGKYEGKFELWIGGK
jgi:hypothetical protein